MIGFENTERLPDLFVALAYFPASNVVCEKCFYSQKSRLCWSAVHRRASKKQTCSPRSHANSVLAIDSWSLIALLLDNPAGGLDYGYNNNSAETHSCNRHNYSQIHQFNNFK